MQITPLKNWAQTREDFQAWAKQDKPFQAEKGNYEAFEASPEYEEMGLLGKGVYQVGKQAHRVDGLRAKLGWGFGGALVGSLVGGVPGAVLGGLVGGTYGATRDHELPKGLHQTPEEGRSTAYWLGAIGLLASPVSGLGVLAGVVALALTTSAGQSQAREAITQYENRPK